MKVFIVGYTMMALATFIWLLFTSGYFDVCQYNAGSCAASVRDLGMQALIWPQLALK